VNRRIAGWLPVAVATAATAAANAMAQVPAGARATPTRVRVGSAPALPAGARVLGALAAGSRLGLTIVLAPRDPAALAAYATAVSTPGSSLYRRYLTVAEFRQRFAPTRVQLDAVRAALTASGLEPGALSPNGLSLELSATAGAIGRAFSTSFERLGLRGGRTAFANGSPPLLPSSAAGLIQGVIGLDDLPGGRPVGLAAPATARPARPARAPARPRAAAAQVVTGGPQPCADATTAGMDYGAYTADQFASSYGFASLYGAGDEGAGVTVGLFEQEPNLTQDIAAYQSCYSTDASVGYVKVDGGAGTGAGIGEAALDIEDVIGLAPAARVIAYQAPDTGVGAYDEWTAMVAGNAVNVISTSWGQCEPAVTGLGAELEEPLFEEAAIQGVSIFAAAGDDGSEDCYDPPDDTSTSLAVDDPGSDPYVTSVGGTSLVAGPPRTEAVWNDQCSASACGGGGGVSGFWQMPGYQADAPASLGVVNPDSLAGEQCGAPPETYCREVPDVSADADPATGYVYFFDGNWRGIGGTSAAAPLWAAFAALVDASSACGGRPIGFANPDLYAAAAGNYAEDFTDVTSGDNDIFGVHGGLYPAGTGYDMASGLGTPAGTELAPALCGIQLSTPGPQSDLLGTPVTLPIAASVRAGAGALTFGAEGLPPGLSIDPSTGVISGTPTGSGSYTVTVVVNWSMGETESTQVASVTFVWTITRPTATAVACLPSPVAEYGPASCTVTVSDTGPGSASAPAGTAAVSATPSGAGSFGAGARCTLAAGPGVASSCTVSYTPSALVAQSIGAAYGGDSAHGPSIATGFALTVGLPPAPSDVGRPSVSGTPRAGSTLICADGRWTEYPSSFVYRWSRNGTPIAGATGSSHRVAVADEGSRLRCSVSGVNAGGVGRSAASAPVSVAVATRAACPAARGRLAGTGLGALRLGMTRAQAKRAYPHSRRRGRGSSETFCLTPFGIEAGYATPALLGGRVSGRRAGLLGRVVWLLSADPRYAVDGVAPGATVAAARRALRGGTLVRAGGGRWYLARAGRATAVLGIHGGIIRQVGIASRLLTASRGADRMLLRSLG
jgi:Pro-kumamolisin, activation domain/Putative Ig domain